MKNGEIIIADSQSAGIGTKGRVWHTGKAKNIAMTIILYPNCTIDRFNNITIKIAEEIRKAILEAYGYKLKIKEPNDLVMDNKKICGILTEVHTMGIKVKYMLISIGFNVNEEDFSIETKEIATSLKKEFHKNFEREEIIKKIIENIEKIIE